MIALEPEIVEKLGAIAAQITQWAQAAKEENKTFVRVDMDPGTAESIANIVGGMPALYKELTNARAILAALCARYAGNAVHLDYLDARWVLMYLEGKIRLELTYDAMGIIRAIRAVVIDAGENDGRLKPGDTPHK